MEHIFSIYIINRSIDNTKGLCGSKYENRSGVMNKSVTSDVALIILSRLVQVFHPFPFFPSI